MALAEMTEAARFVHRLQGTTEAPGPQSAVVAVLSDLDDLLADGRWADCNAILGEAVSRRVDRLVLLALLAATVFAPREELDNRPALYEHAMERYASETGAERASKILRNLR